MDEGKPRRNAPTWIKIFVVFHLVCITMWSLPDPKKPYMNRQASFGIDTSSPSSVVKSFSETVTEGFLYLNWQYLKKSPLVYYPGITGFWQYWDMFSPNPSNVDLYLEADVFYKDGSQYRFHFPRIYTMSIPEKYLKERYRKYYENANSASYGGVRPALSQRIALECFKDPMNPPVKVTLYRFYDVIEPPGTPTNPNYSSEKIFVYQVDQAKLRRDKGLDR
jgi:hypothetical protein